MGSDSLMRWLPFGMTKILESVVIITAQSLRVIFFGGGAYFTTHKNMIQHTSVYFYF